LEEIRKRSQAFLNKENTAALPDEAKDTQEVVSLVEELWNAIVSYQVNRAAQINLKRMERISRERSIYNQINKLIVRLLVNSSNPELTKHRVVQVLPRHAPETARGAILRICQMPV